MKANFGRPIEPERTEKIEDVKTMTISVALIRKLDQIPPDLRDILLAVIEELEQHRQTVVTKEEFGDLKKIVADLAVSVRELAEAQKRTELRVNELAEAQKRTEQRLNELAEAQKRTEERLNELAEAQKRTELRLNELAEAQKRTEERLNELAEAQNRTEERLNELAEAQKRTELRLNELAEAQKRTEERLNELAEAQKRTELRLNELAEAQKRTEEEVASLARVVKGTREQVGGLSRSLAYALENEAYRKLPAYLEKVHRIRIVESMIRTEVADEEVNFWARAVKDGKDVRLVGESVLRLDDASKLKVLRRKVEKIARLFGMDLIPILVTHYAKPKVLQQASESGILVVQSYEWDQSL